ncbi:MAG: hypothetical protein KDK65_04760 [Chlamydiia bacterium]|nr:hypothetical protein [Chlamydiia bacterium]
MNNKRVRILAILHLCLALTLLCWYGGYPFFGHRAKVKELKQEYEWVMQKETFHDLPREKREKIQHNWKKLKEIEVIPWQTKLFYSGKTLLLHLPYFELFWLVFSLVLPIMILKETPGIRGAIWILPLMALAHVVDQPYLKPPVEDSPETVLYPSEERLLTQYTKEPLAPSWSEQKKQLERGWKIYLVKEWAKETPAKEPALFSKQVAKGQHAFTAEKLLLTPLFRDDFFIAKGTETHLKLFIYLVWNVFFAWMTTTTEATRRRSLRGSLA